MGGNFEGHRRVQGGMCSESLIRGLWVTPGMLETYSVEIRGTRPLLMHKYEPVEQSARTKRGTIPNPEDEAKKSLYQKEDGTVFVPSMWIEGALTNAAKEFKMMGRRTYRDTVRASVVVDPLEIPIQPQAYVVDRRSAVIQRARILRARPRWDVWSLAFKIQVSDERIREANLKEFLEEAGRTVGIGDYRPKFGLYSVEKFEHESPSLRGGRT